MYKLSVKKDGVLLLVRMFQTRKSAQKFLSLCLQKFEAQGFTCSCRSDVLDFADLVSPDNGSIIVLEIDEQVLSHPTALGARLLFNYVVRAINNSNS